MQIKRLLFLRIRSNYNNCFYLFTTFTIPTKRTMKQLFLASMCWVLFSCGGNLADDAKNQEELKIACAANMQGAVDSIVTLFKAEHNILCTVTFGSSGMLTSQIQNGAPYDIFLSANMIYPQQLYKKGLGTVPQIYAQGKLVFVHTKNTSFSTIEQAVLSTPIKRIALANSETAPYGMAAESYLKNTGLKTKIKDKIITGEDIGQVNQYITTKTVDAGFTTFAFKVQNPTGYTYFEVDSTYFEPINQGVSIVHKQHKNSNAQKFVDYLLTSKKAQAVLHYFGYNTL